MEYFLLERVPSWPALIYAMQDLLQDGPAVYLVGGIVRDAYLNRPIKDIDLAVAGDGRPIARKIANAFGGSYYPLDDERQVGRAIVQHEGQTWVVDVSALRGAANDVLADLLARDFSMNAMAIPLGSAEINEIYDPLGGLKDLNDKILRRAAPDSIATDPIRAWRAVRQSLKYGLLIEAATKEDIKREGPNFIHTSGERLRDELFGLLSGPKPRTALMTLDILGLLRLAIPEVQLMQKNGEWLSRMLWLHTLDNLLAIISPQRDDNIGANAGFGTLVYLLDIFRPFLKGHIGHIWAAPSGGIERPHSALMFLSLLLLDSPAESIEERGYALKLTSDEIKRLGQLVAHHQAADELLEQEAITARQIYRYWAEHGAVGVDALLLWMARYLAENGTSLEVRLWSSYVQKVRQFLEGYDNAMHISPLLSGTDVMQSFGLTPSPLIGQALSAIREAQALGEIHSREEALNFLREWFQGE